VWTLAAVAAGKHVVLDGAGSVVTLADSRSAAATLSALLGSARDTTALYPE